MASWFRNSFSITRNQLRKMRKDSRVWLTGVLLFILLIRYLWGIDWYGYTYGTKTTPFLLSVLYADGIISNGLLKVLLYLGVIAIFCDAPFYSQQTPYEVVRCGKKAWNQGKLTYIWLMSFMYPLYLSLVALAIVLPTVTFTDFWGGTMRDFAELYQHTLDAIGNLMIPKEIIKTIYPWWAHFLTFVISGLSNVFLGYLIYFLNLLTLKNGVGVSFAVFIVMIDPIVRYWGVGVENQWLYRCSPISWSSIENWTIVGSDHPISMEYACCGYLLLILVLGCLIRVVSVRKEALMQSGM